MKKWEQIAEWSRCAKARLGDAEEADLENEHPVVRRVVERLRDPKYLQAKGEEQTKFDAETAFKKLKRHSRLRLFMRWGAAAASVAILAGCFYLFHSETKTEMNAPMARQTIIPGGKQATLRLEDGRKFELNDTVSVRIVTDKGIIRIDSSGAVLGKLPLLSPAVKAKDNILSIPRGGEYHLTLSDGTEVWLNSETELRFPMQFTDSIRQVFLKGEAYFDVSRNPQKPFIVRTPAGDINVLGTSFDVMIYDPTRLAVTLEKGSVSYRNGGQPDVKLQPGEQLTYSARDNHLSVEKVNTKIYTAWKDRLFCFEEQRLEEIMATLSRWYNLNVEFKNEELKYIELSGTLDRYSHADPLLRLFELGANVKFETQGNTVIVKKAK